MVRDRYLSAGIDDGFAADLPDECVDDHQSAAQGVEWHVDEAGGRALVFRVRNVDAIMTEIDEDPLADQSFGAEHSFSAAEGIRDDGQNRLVDRDIADGECIHTDGVNGGVAGDGAANS